MSAAGTCAACGVEGDELKQCTSCEEVKYCDVACQRAHWPRHKKGCKKRAAEIKDSLLFKEHVREDCPICFLPMPISGHVTYRSCCGKWVCDGCMHGIIDGNDDGDNMLGDCPFCRAPSTVDVEVEMERVKARMEMNDPEAYHALGSAYWRGNMGLPKDRKMAIDLWFKAARLGHAYANCNIGIAYAQGIELKMDQKKAKHHLEIAAMRGDVKAKHYLGAMETSAGYSSRDSEITQRGLRLLAIAAKAGYEPSLQPIKTGYSKGYITKDEYATILRAYQKSKEEMMSDRRASGIDLYRN
ncbi:hypothetical protein ACHAWF_008763 [Thalassiosira exigua]